MPVDPKDAILVGTYTTEQTAQLISSALETQNIPVTVVVDGSEGISSRPNVALFVSSVNGKRARQIARAFEAPVLRTTGAPLPLLGTVSNIVPILILFLSYTDATGAISTAYSLTLFLPNVVLIVFFVIAVTVRTFLGAYSSRKHQRYVILYYLSVVALSIAIFLDISGTLR